MTLTCIQARGDAAMVTNQHRDQDCRADRAFLEEAIARLRDQAARAIASGWTGETTAGGQRLVVAGGDGPFREVLAETQGGWAEPVQTYLLTVQPMHILSVLALLEAVSREVSRGEASTAVRHAALGVAQLILGKKRPATDTRRPTQ